MKNTFKVAAVVLIAAGVSLAVVKLHERNSKRQLRAIQVEQTDMLASVVQEQITRELGRLPQITEVLPADCEQDFATGLHIRWSWDFLPVDGETTSSIRAAVRRCLYPADALSRGHWEYRLETNVFPGERRGEIALELECAEWP